MCDGCNALCEGAPNQNGWWSCHSRSLAVFFSTTADMAALTPGGAVNVLDYGGPVPGSSPPLGCYPKTLGRNAAGTQYTMLMFCEARRVFSSAVVVLR